MNFLLFLLFGVLYFGLVGLLCVGLIMMIIACIAKKWRFAGYTLAAWVGVLGAFCLLMWVACYPDLYVREPPAPGELMGTYTLTDRWSVNHLNEMGYKVLDGQITLKPDMTFSASRIPACCVHGWDEISWGFSGGYYTLSGTWALPFHRNHPTRWR